MAEMAIAQMVIARNITDRPGVFLENRKLISATPLVLLFADT